jgi:RNA polymerase sigma-70 factor (ECF subfamily)
VSDPSPAPTAPARELVALYDRSVGEVFGYLVRRCESRDVAEDLTSEVFMAAVDALRRDRVPELTIAWLIGVARHKLVDHWRRTARDERNLQAVQGGLDELDDPWDETIDAARAHEVLSGLGSHHRVALTLRYLDGLPVPMVATELGRTIHATEALLVRARNAFRVAYGERGDHG